MWHKGVQKTTTEMKLDTANFYYLGMIVEGFFFGGISVLQQSRVSF